MEDATKPEGAVEDSTPAPVETREDAEKSAKAADDPRTSIYAKYDAIKAAREAAEEPPAEETTEEAPPKEASESKEEPKAETAKEPEVEELTPDQFAEKYKHVRVKGKFAGEEAVVDAKTLLKVQGLERHLTKRLQEVARKEEAMGAIPKPPVEYQPTIAPTGDKALRYWGENEIAYKYDELFSESPYKATQFLNTVQTERQKAQQENEKIRMDTSERDFLALHAELDPADYESMKASFSDADYFRRNTDIDAAFQRGDYYGALELAYTKVERQKINNEREAMKAARDAAMAEDNRKAELKKKGSVIRTASKPESKPVEEFKVLTPEQVIREEAARRRKLRGQ